MDSINYNMYGEFNAVDDNIFDNFSNMQIYNQPEVDIKYNYCNDCNIPLILNNNEYQCSQCGVICEYNNYVKEHENASNSSIRICTGSNKGRFYNINGDYTKTQKKFIIDQLNQNYSNFVGNTFPHSVLANVATQYNYIQKLITEDDIDNDGYIRGQKKFVRRGNIKDEVLAGLIYFECIRAGLMRKKKDIALFMKLPTSGFSRGEDILRNLQAEGKIDIPINEKPIDGFVDRYLELLNMKNAEWKNFIIKLVEESEQYKIGMNSQISSKVVAVIWIIILQCNLKITATEVEKACDNTQKNTFIKFTKIVGLHSNIFAHIYKEHSVPLYIL